MMPTVRVGPKHGEVGVSYLTVVWEADAEPAVRRSQVRTQPEVYSGSDVVDVPMQPKDAARVHRGAVAVMTVCWRVSK